MDVKLFTKRAVIVAAEQWFPGKKIDGVDEYYDPDPTGHDPSYPVVRTPNGPVRIEPGEWIITGILGECYPCKPEIFEATYERVEPESPEPDRPPTEDELRAEASELRAACPGCGDGDVRQCINEFSEPEWYAHGWKDEDQDPVFICFCPFCGYKLADPAMAPTRVRIK
jgi:hypothetical protein